MIESDTEELDWSVRALVYRHIVDEGRPPTAAEISAATGIGPEEVRAVYQRLHERRALFLAAGGDTIRMAIPFSGAPTPFHVHAGGQSYWANCAWDALGIPAALHADAMITAEHAEDDSKAELATNGNEIQGSGVVHFLMPFRRWFEDLVHT